LSVLALVVGALLFDWVIAPPRVRAANEKLLEEVRLYNETGLKPGSKKGDLAATGKPDGMLYSADIQEILGMTPSKVESTELYTIEHYRWWGWIPRNRNYITVLYIGEPTKPHYSTHYANMMPEDGVVPGKRRSETVEVASESNHATGGTPGKAPEAGRPAMAPGMMPPMMGPGMGAGMRPPGGGGKGKGRPQSKADQKGGEPKEPEEGAKKTKEPKTGDEPKAKEPAKAEGSTDEGTAENDKKESK